MSKNINKAKEGAILNHIKKTISIDATINEANPFDKFSSGTANLILLAAISASIVIDSKRSSKSKEGYIVSLKHLIERLEKIKHD